MRDRTRLAAARPGTDQDGTADRLCGLPLRVVQPGQDAVGGRCHTGKFHTSRRGNNTSIHSTRENDVGRNPHDLHHAMVRLLLQAQGATGPRGRHVPEVNIESDPAAAAFVESVNGGNQTVPTVVFSDGTAFTNPRATDVAARVAARV